MSPGADGFNRLALSIGCGYFQAHRQTADVQPLNLAVGPTNNRFDTAGIDHPQAIAG
jgi:hypothetical protein